MTATQTNGRIHAVTSSASALTFDEVRKVAAATFGDAGAHLADLWAWYNETLFAGELKPILVCRSKVFPYGGCIGLTKTAGGDDPHRHILVKQFSPRVNDQQRGVLLHEMLHAALFDRGVNIRHAGQPWCDEIMRLSERMGSPIWAGRYTVLRVGDGQRRGNKPPPPDKAGLRELTQKEIARWPGSIGLIPPDLPFYVRAS